LTYSLWFPAIAAARLVRGNSVRTHPVCVAWNYKLLSQRRGVRKERKAIYDCIS